MNTDDWSGHLVLIMAPSGSGKSQLIEFIRKRFSGVEYALTRTTRARRPKESLQKTYRFLSKEEFEKMVEKDEFLEWAEFGGNKYGTAKTEIYLALKNGKIILKEMELQGINLIKKIIPSKFVTVIYIDAGPWEALKRRILGRAPMSEEELSLRYTRYQKEVIAKKYADVIIKNYDGMIKRAKEELANIIESIIQKIEK